VGLEELAHLPTMNQRLKCSHLPLMIVGITLTPKSPAAPHPPCPLLVAVCSQLVSERGSAREEGERMDGVRDHASGHGAGDQATCQIRESAVSLQARWGIGAHLFTAMRGLCEIEGGLPLLVDEVDVGLRLEQGGNTIEVALVSNEPH
jgi:hypothetical protein